MTDGSARVLVSPRFSASPRAILRRIRRMILPDRGFRQSSGPADSVRLGNRADLAGHHFYQFAFQISGWLCSVHRGDKSMDRLTLDIMRNANHRGFGHCRVQHQGALNFGSAQPVSGNTQDIINPAGDPVITIFITTGSISGEVITRENG